MLVSGLERVEAIAVGGFFACALLANGSVECWGDDGFGELGVGDEPEGCDGASLCSTLPVVVPGLSEVTAISAGYMHACALRRDGTVACWGGNDAGQVGNGTTGPDLCGNNIVGCSRTPSVVKNLTGVTAIAAGDQHTCALLSNGGVACWGDNSSLELGDGVIEGPEICAGPAACSTNPVFVPGLTGVTAIAAGWGTTCAVVDGRQVECWGNDTFGQVGDSNAQANRARPVRVSGLY